MILVGVTIALQEEGVLFTFSSSDDLSNRFKALKTKNHALSEQLKQAQTAIVATKEEISEQLRISRLAVALLQLRITSQTHLPFERELTLVRQLGRDERGLFAVMTVLAPHAATGVATVAQLRDGFGLILLPKLKPVLAEDEQDWVDWAFSWVNLVFIPFSLSQPSPRQQLVNSATDRLTEDDLRGAVDLITQLDGPAAALVVRWLKEANARLAVDTAYLSLSGIALALLGHTY
jgi:hypothetical protein